MPKVCFGVDVKDVYHEKMHRREPIRDHLFDVQNEFHDGYLLHNLDGYNH